MRNYCEQIWSSCAALEADWAVLVSRARTFSWALMSISNCCSSRLASLRCTGHC